MGYAQVVAEDVKQAAMFRDVSRRMITTKHVAMRLPAFAIYAPRFSEAPRYQR